MFSQYFKYLIDKLQFILIVVVRFFKILFRRKKRIEEIYLNYETKHLFDNSYIIIKYRFKNALWYRFGRHRTLEKQIKIFNLKNFEKEFDLIVYGFFRKEVYHLKFKPQLQFDNSNFKASISNLNLKLEEQPNPQIAFPGILLHINRPIIEAPKISIENPTITIKTSTYNQNEFI